MQTQCAKYIYDEPVIVVEVLCSGTRATTLAEFYEGVASGPEE